MIREAIDVIRRQIKAVRFALESSGLDENNG